MSLYTRWIFLWGGDPRVHRALENRVTFLSSLAIVSQICTLLSRFHRSKNRHRLNFDSFTEGARTLEPTMSRETYHLHHSSHSPSFLGTVCRVSVFSKHQYPGYPRPCQSFDRNVTSFDAWQTRACLANEVPAFQLFRITLSSHSFRS